MSLPPSVQTLVDQMLIELKVRALSPSSVRIDLDRDGTVQKVTPELTFRRDATRLDTRR